MIDAHIHVVPPNLPGVGTLGKTLRQPPDAIADCLRAEMQAAGVTSAFAMGQWTCDETDPLGVRSTLAIAAKVPGLKAIGILDPTRGHDRDHLARVDQALAAREVVALKAYLGYLHFGPADPGYRPYYELAARHKLPVYFHTGDTYSPYAKLKYAHPLGVDEVAVDHPDTKFIIAHCGNPWTLDCAAVVYKNLNVWADLSGLCVGDGDHFLDEEQRDTLNDLSAAVRKAFRYAERPTRFLFGTDWPLIPLAPYRQFIASIIPPQYHADVFLENAQTLFRLGTG